MTYLQAGAGLSTDIDAVRAAAEASNQAVARLLDPPNLVVAFVSQAHHDTAEDVAEFLAERFAGATIVGCVSDGVIGGARELETGPALSVWAAFLPETRIDPFELQFVEAGDGEGLYTGWPEDVAPGTALMMFVDPFSIPVEHLLAGVNRERQGVRVIGGVASGVHAADEARLILGSQVRTSGAVAVAINGRVRVDTLVSQGCRPIGAPAVITRADRQIIFELGGQRPIDRIRDMWTKGSPRDRSLLANGPLFIGIAADEYKPDFARGDFLVRAVVGANPEQGWVAVGDVVEAGQTVQFHVRDPETAGEDLLAMLSRLEGTPAAALLFTCNGRGSNMFDEPDHDAGAVSEAFGAPPLAGFFANGELGPVGSKNFLHGHTASLALFFDPK